MSLKDQIHELFGVKEAHELPAAVMKIVMDSEELSKVITDYRKSFPDLKQDVLRDYFQECSADRKSFMQDYTPDGICKLVSGMAGHAASIADLCAGTGSLTISAWIENPEAHFTCWELSSAALPLLLFNLAVRKIEATVVHGDLLTRETQAVYEVSDGKICRTDQMPELMFDAVISNPPYSLKWSGEPDERFKDYPIPPKSKADFAFALVGLSMLKPDGEMIFVLPHGVLFRGSSEGKIRKKLLEEGKITGVIGLASALFANTTIPVAVLNLKNQVNPEQDVLFIDASKTFQKQKAQNTMSDQDLETILSAWKAREPRERFAELVSMAKIVENDYNLNIPRYVDSSEPEPEIVLLEVAEELEKISKEIQKTESVLAKMLKQLTCKDDEDRKAQDILIGEFTHETDN